jgi:hypothetical protein
MKGGLLEAHVFPKGVNQPGGKNAPSSS